MAGPNLARDEAGNIWEVDAQGNPVRLHSAAGVQIKPPNPALPLDLKSKQLGVEKDQADLSLTPYQLRKQAADAAKAELDLKQAQDEYASQHPKGSTATVLGPDSLKSLSPPDREIVKALADGRLAFPAGFALKAPWWQQKLDQVAAYDPSFDATNYNNRAKARAMLLTGKVGTSANALNTAIGHLGLLQNQIGGTASHNFTPLNHLINTFEQLIGDPGITNFKDTAGKLASELTSVYRNGGGAEADVVRQLESVDPNASEQQKQGIIRNALELLASKQAANLYQYNIGSGGKPEVDLLDPGARAVLDKFPDIRDKYFGTTPAALSPAAAALIAHNGGTPPSPPPPSRNPADGGPPPVGPHDYSGLTGPNGGAGGALATGAYRNQFDPVMANALSTFIKKGVPYDTAAQFAQRHGFNPPDPQAYAQAVSFAKAHGGATNVAANRSVPTTMGERLASSPAAAALAGGVTGATAGLSDVAGRSLAGPAWDANRAALAATNPTADLLGNVGGGLAAAALGPGLLRAASPAAADAAGQIGARLGGLAPVAGDTAYGATYGASENPANPVQGAFTGGVVGAGGGMFARGATKAIGRTIAPVAGAMAPLYDQGVLPTIGQRAAAMQGPISSRIGKAINVTEQALQSVPLLGALPAVARQGARNDFQLGAFNDALSPLKDALPAATKPGPEAHSYTAKAFGGAYDKARSGMQFVADEPFGNDYGNFTKALSDGTLTSDQAGQVQKAIDTSLNGRIDGGAMNGANYKAAVSDLQRKAATWAANPNTAAQAPYLSHFATMLDDAARRNSDPASTALLDAADHGYAKFVRIQQASKLGGAAKDAGTFTPSNYAASVKGMGGGLRSNAYSRGDALGQDYANAGLKLSDSLPDSGTPVRLATIQGAEGLGLAATHHLGMLANPVTLGMFAPYVGRIGNKLVAPRNVTLPPFMAEPLNTVGNAIYDRAGLVGQAGAPGALSLLYSQ